MSASLRERLIAALTACPCCRWDRVQTNTQDDGIPGNCVHESVFRCGGAVFVTEEDKLKAGRPCPGPLEDECDELFERVTEELEGEDA